MQLLIRHVLRTHYAEVISLASDTFCRVLHYLLEERSPCHTPIKRAGAC